MVDGPAGSGDGGGPAAGGSGGGRSGDGGSSDGSAAHNAAHNVTRDTDLATSLEVASSLWAKFMGLMGRPSLASGAGSAAHNVTRDTDLATSLEVASSLWAKFMGLMGRPSLASGAGLWLPDSNGIHMMFMRFPIDAIFLDRADAAGLRRVVSVHRSLRAWTGLVPLVRGAHGVLELPVGTIDDTGTLVGDLVRIDD